MIADLDALMNARGIAAVIVPMHETMHPSFRWLSRGAKVTRAFAVKAAGAEPVLVTFPMERDEAAATGLPVRLASEFGWDAIFRDAPTAVDAHAEFFDAMLTGLRIDGPVAFFGNIPVHLYLAAVEALEKRGRSVCRSNGDDLIQLARKRKDAREIEAIASVGERTEQVVDEVRAVLRSSKAEGERVVFDGRALTMGDLKEVVRSGIARRGLVEDHETILSHGRDAGVPHSRGDASMPVRPGVPIVLDIFPVDQQTGYFFDLTRTFCVGAIPDALRKIHADVLEAFELAAARMVPGTKASTYQNLVCDFFEARGYATARSNPATFEGYVHGLGHGVGLDIHERPSFSIAVPNDDRVEEGDILTIEPGLYFPDREIGVRIEDTFVVTATGVKSLARSSRALEP